MGILTLETNKYALKLDNFEGPLDLLCHLIDKNKMDIYDVKLSDIAEQYIEYINEMEAQNLDITSEFLVIASTLVYIKSKELLPKEVEDEAELTEEELLRRIIEYKKYKDISERLKDNFILNCQRFYKLPDNVKLPQQKIEREYEAKLLYSSYKKLIEKNKNKIKEKIAIFSLTGIMLLSGVSVATLKKSLSNDVIVTNKVATETVKKEQKKEREEILSKNLCWQRNIC